MLQPTVLTAPSQTAQWADQVASAADSDRRALGFIPKPKYAAACDAGRIFVATVLNAAGRQEYAGHVMFGGAGSELHIQQLYVAPTHRKHGIAKALLSSVTSWAESRNYLGIAIRVAADLRLSNLAWERLGFALIRKVPGRGTRKRDINLRHKELKSHSLLQFVQAVGRDNINFSVPPNVGRGVPTYVVDLNVYFDCLRERGRRPAALALFRAAFSTLFRLVTTSEFHKELERHTPKHQPIGDPVLELARALPSLPYEPNGDDKGLAHDLSMQIFSNRTIAGKLNERDRSDIAHLIVAIRSRAAGFVTSERALILQRQWVLEKFGTDIVPVEEIVDYLKDAKPSVQGRTISRTTDVEFSVFDPATSDGPQILKLCDRANASSTARQKLTAWLNRTDGHRLVGARTSKGIIAALGWQLVGGPPRQVEGILIVDIESDAAPAAVDFLSEALIHAASAPSVARIDLQTPELADPLRQVLLDHGFTKGEGITWTKVSVGRHIGGGQWSNLAHDIKALCGLSLPANLLSEKFAYSRMLRCEMDDGRTWIGSLDELEGLLSPTILAYPDRAATVIPIRATFSEGLFGHLQQGSLFRQPIASFRRERMYFTASRSFSLFDRGTPLLFYESAPGNGRAAVIAAARSLGARTIMKSELQALTLARGVLDQKEIQGLGVRRTVTAISFDNVILFPKPVTLKQMRARNWVPSTNFVTATKISGETAKHLLDLGHRK